MRKRRKNYPLRGFHLIRRLRKPYRPYYNTKFVNQELNTIKYAYYGE
jgi:hypothetical protein